MDGGAIPKVLRSNAAQLASPTYRLAALDRALWPLRDDGAG